ncbi:hypothetical protein RirG_202290 [Rhizophagus irregularis DAOM 197198w]|uniref:Uncharacterized protein n=1 Tax=Rhizophagus irregularis (strain DAOM 197198w) TaxID=1432141 RepID=A0A015LTC0_RHIIW|nr:hypothetical protein RirG_202290 [Rhizophagus irregularis DAOM 197198w]
MLIAVKKNITKTDLVGGQFRARELTIDEADRLREQQEIELEQHRLRKKESSVKKLWKQN